MNIKMRPLMMGAGIGAALLLLVSIIVQAGGYFAATSVTGSLNDPENLIGMAGISSVVSCIGLICPAILVILAGFVYGRMANQEGPMETQDAAIGGAAAGAAAGVIYGVVNAILAIIVAQFFLADVMSDLNDLAAGSGLAGLTGTGGSAISGVIGTCCWLVGGAVLGAVGGIIANAMANRGKA